MPALNEGMYHTVCPEVEGFQDLKYTDLNPVYFCALFENRLY